MPDYRTDVTSGPRSNAVSKFLNLKRVFDDAVRQERWTRERDATQNMARQSEQRIQTAGQLASTGVLPGSDLNAFMDTGKFPESFGNTVQPTENIEQRMSNAGIPLEEQSDYYVAPKTYLNKGNPKTVEAFMKKRVITGGIVDDLGRMDGTNDNLTRNMETLVSKGMVSGPGYSTIAGPGSDIYSQYVKSPEFNAWKASVGRTFQQYRKWATGVAAGYPELQMLAPLYPKPTDRPEIFIKKTIDVIKENRNIRNRIVENFGKAGYAVSGFKQEGEQTQQNQVGKYTYE